MSENAQSFSDLSEILRTHVVIDLTKPEAEFLYGLLYWGVCGGIPESEEDSPASIIIKKLESVIGSNEPN